MFVILICEDHCSPFSSGVFTTTTALWFATMTVFGVMYTAMLSWQNFQLNTEEYARPYGWHRMFQHALVLDNCWFSLSLSVSRQRRPSHSSSSQRPWQHPETKSQLLFSSKGSTVTVQDLAACLSGCTYVCMYICYLVRERYCLVLGLAIYTC